MGKRRATEALVSDQAAKRQDTDRARIFAVNLRALNSQFAQWVQQQAHSCCDQLWLDGVQDYAKHMEKLLEDYGDVIEQPDKCGPSPPVPSNFTLTPGPSSAPAAGASTAERDDTAGMFGGLVGPPTGGSTGRKSVTFAASPAYNTPAGPAAGSSNGFGTPHFGTPRTEGFTGAGATANTAHAGHTPAPVGGFAFTPLGTPNAAATPSSGGSHAANASASCAAVGNAMTSTAAAPQATGNAAGGQSPGNLFGSTTGNAAGGQSPGNLFGSTTPGSFGQQTLTFPTQTAAETGPVKSSLFGISSNSKTPAADGSNTAMAWPGNNNSSATFSFGVSTDKANANSGGDAAASSSTPPFAFGTPSTAAGAAGNSSTPGTTTWTALPSSAGAAAGSAVAGFGSGSGSSMPQVAPAPAAAAPASANGGAGGDDGDDAAADEGRRVYKSDLKVDEALWNVFFQGKAKLHIKVENAESGQGWSELGLGLLTVRQPKEGPNSQHWYVIFSTEGGKQLVVSQLVASSQVYGFDKHPKKCRMWLNVLQYNTPPTGAGSGDAAATAAAESKPKYVRQVCMISLRSEKDVATFTDAVQQKRPSA